ncbi:AzlD domain-containing protein [Solirubrobacter sp. CPCC 204708]|uniref:AzlD domain-containing protein n=1 Tax=Solirubrobacter deserti TaxID=2282478 RepID=A0ABT4RJR0_9ACTN|nr:AzlD domain-containing protein [Solirubrobacter deserti]MBE2319765.1 AzlD domain-containing protein [Solirubrobacter deserti]MDA0138752.1 AzlD domain-containing protein [Solirubrobacter deserti]
MTAVWITVAVLTVGTFAAKASGTLVLGDRELPPRALNVTALLAPALLAGLLVFETLGAEGGGLTVDARAAGLVAAIVAILLKAPMFAVVLVAAAAAAGLRLFT